MKNRLRRSCAAVLLTVLVAASASCGRKTDPMTPESPRPAAVHMATAAVRDTVAFLSWALPAKNVEGKEMRPEQIKRFLIYRAEIGPEKKRPRYRQIAVIEPENPAPAQVAGGIVLWKDPNLKYGRVYSYRVRAEGAAGGMSAYSDEVRVAPLLTVALPKNVVVTAAGDGQVALAWDAVTTKMDGSRHEGFVGYNVYRGTAPGQEGGKPLNGEPVRTPSYTDKTVANGKTYFYMVRSVDSPALPWRESLDSAEATTTPRKITPPARPAGLTVVPGVGRIFLTWNENAEPDVAGYHVYRSTRSGRDFERLTDKPINRTTYSDEAVKPGTIYYYTVTAVDQADNESQPSKELSARAERAR